MNTERRNYTAFLLDGALFVGGVNFVNTGTLLPGIILDEGGPAWLAALAPSAMVVGLFTLPILTAGMIDRARHLKPWVLHFGLLQRGVYLLAALLLLIPGFGEANLIWIIALTPLLSGMLGGAAFAGFQKLLIRSVPPHLRASNLAMRFLLGGLTGIIAGRAIEWMLATFALGQALSLLHACAFVWMMLSWVALSRVHERPKDDGEVADEAAAAPSLPTRGALREFFVEGPRSRDRRKFLFAMISMHGFLIVAPFFAAHLQRSAGEQAPYLGVLAMWQMIGVSAGNLLAARLGDLFGGRWTMGLGASVMSVVCLCATFVDGRYPGIALYAFFSMGMMILVVGKDTLLYDIAPPRRQARFLSVIALITGATLLSFSGLGFLLWELTAFFPWLAAAAAALSVICLLLTRRLSEPRQGVHKNPLEILRRGLLRYF